MTLAVALAACTGPQKVTPAPSSKAVPTTSPDVSTVEVPAPIDDVEVHISESWPPDYAVEITSGLPNGCTELERITGVVEEDGVKIEVVNTQPAPGADIACDQQYRQVTSVVKLGSGYEPGKKFTVSVNGVEETFTGYGCSVVDPDDCASELAYETVEAPAPIETVEILEPDSDTPRYQVRIVFGLPNGCVKFERVDTSRDGTTINVQVINTVPAPHELVACMTEYETSEHTVPLGYDFEPGRTYTVQVNDVTETFVAR